MDVYPNDVLNDYPDLVKNTGKVYIYVLPNDYFFEELTNESKELREELEIYVTIRGYTKDQLKTYIGKYIQAIYNLVNSSNTLGVYDYCMVTNIHPFNDVEGFENAKAALIKIQGVKET